MSTIVTSLEELMQSVLDARAEVARLEAALAGAKAEARLIEKELNDHPDVEEDRVYYHGHVFEWRHQAPIAIWPCRYFPSPDGPTRDFA